MKTLTWIWACLCLAVLPRNSKMAQDLRCRHDLHDIYDDAEYMYGDMPWHFTTYKCERCGKDFEI